MIRTDFSTEQTQVIDLTFDLARGDFERHITGTNLSRKDLENHLRSTIKNDILKGKTLYQAYRSNNHVVFEVIEEIVNIAIGEDIIDSPFMDAFVEFKNRKLGDESEFYSEGGLLSVAVFAGNHWDTNRQSIDLGSVYTLPREWAFIHFYDDLERFLTGIITIDKMLDKVYKSFNKFIQDRLYSQFQNVATAVPVEFTAVGNDEDAVGSLCDLVQAAGGYGSLTIAGTKGALRKLAGIVPDKMFADSQRESKTKLGCIGEWEGNKLMVIPQTLKSGTFDLALDDNMIFIMGGDVKPIKLEFIGDTRAKMETDGKANNDQSVDVQVQTLIGMGLVLPEYFGVFTFA